MAQIRRYGPFAMLRSDASSHIIYFRDGAQVRQGRGLAFWFRPDRASLAELPMDDREMTLFGAVQRHIHESKDDKRCKQPNRGHLRPHIGRLGRLRHQERGTLR